ncbi:MAG: hypothetical protein EOM14_00015 [Clostridia bacterium]|nr:hypothetical protein [Clostridia bacterium]
MLCYIRANDQKSIRGKLIALYALNVSDALLTYWLIGTGYFSEVNFLLKGVVLNFGELFLIKIVFPAVLIAWLYFRIHSATEKQLKPGNIAVNSALLLYTSVNILHFVWAGIFLALGFAYASSTGFVC